MVKEVAWDEEAGALRVTRTFEADEATRKLIEERRARDRLDPEIRPMSLDQFKDICLDIERRGKNAGRKRAAAPAPEMAAAYA